MLFTNKLTWIYTSFNWSCCCCCCCCL